MKFRWKHLLWVVIALGVAVLMLVARHYRAKASVEAYRKQLRAQGEKLTVSELIPEFPADELNGGPDLLIAARSLYSLPSNWPPLMKSISPGYALVGWAEENSPAQESTNIWPEFARSIRAHAEPLAKARAALKRQELSFPVDYSQGTYMPLPHLANVKNAALWFSLAAILELHENHASNAWENLEACVALARLDVGEPLQLSQLVRASISHIAISTTWEALQYPGWQEEQLAGLQKAWGSFDLLGELGPSLAMERAFDPQLFAICRNSFDETSSMFGSSAPTNSGPSTLDDWGEALTNPKESFRSFMDRYPRFWAWKWWWSYEEELSNLQSFQAGLDAVRSVRTNNAFVPALTQLNEAFTNLHKLHPQSDQKFLLNLDPGAYVSRYLAKLVTVELGRRILVTAIALQRYHLHHGEYPKELKDMIPDYLQEVPIDLMDGKPLRYHPKPDGSFLLYSVGEDGQDNGGDPSSTSTPGSTTIERWWKGRDAVWPTPATPEQTKAYEDKMMADWMTRQASRKLNKTNSRDALLH